MGASDDLDTRTDIDLAQVELTYERFRQLALNKALSANGRAGFAEHHRVGYTGLILDDICRKLPQLLTGGKVVLDIGIGCSDLSLHFLEFCGKHGHRLIAVDSEEVLARLPDAGHVVKIAGRFPDCLDAVTERAGGRVDAVLMYSVLQYVMATANPYNVLDAIIPLLGPGGDALIGDIPNISKRKRFFSSPTGVRFHQQTMRTDELPVVRFNAPEAGKIDDAVIAGLMQRAQAAGCDAYLLPQGPDLPLANRRDDLLVRRP